VSFCITNFGSLLVGGRDQRDPDFTAYLALLKSLSKDNPRPSLEHTDFVNLQPGSFLLSCAADINYVVGDPNGRTLQPGNLVIISDSIQKRGWTSTTSEPIVVEIHLSVPKLEQAQIQRLVDPLGYAACVCRMLSNCS
jgi:hypothetical protein